MTNQKHLKKESFARRLIDDSLELFHLSIPEIVYVLSLVALLTFFTTIAFVRLEVSAELDQSFKIPKEIVQHYGFPFDNVRRIFFDPYNQEVPGHHVTPKFYTVYESNSEIAWSGLFMNFMIYSLFSFVIVKAIVKVKEKAYYYRYNEG
jgi:hypothetical protein